MDYLWIIVKTEIMEIKSYHPQKQIDKINRFFNTKFKKQPPRQAIKCL